MPFIPITKNKLKQCALILDKKYRHGSKLFPIEGIHLFEEFLKSGFEAEWIAVDPSFEREHPQLADRIRKRFSSITFRTTQQEFKKISDTEHAQGIAAAIHQKPPDENEVPRRASRELIVVLDKISDPGNLGTILRSADWFGVKKIILSASCVEVYNPKVIRASMGSIFRVACYERMNLPDFLREIRSQSHEVYSASPGGQTLNEAGLSVKSVLVIGNESHGISEDLRAFCDHEIKIPQHGGGESLNAAVACSILLYAFSKSIHE